MITLKYFNLEFKLDLALTPCEDQLRLRDAVEEGEILLSNQSAGEWQGGGNEWTQRDTQW